MATPADIIDWARAAALLGAGICMGVGSVGPAIGQGFIGERACEAIGKNPENAGIITRTMITALAFVESSAIYALIISLLLIFFGRS